MCVQVLRVGDRDGLELCRYRPPSDLPILGMLHCGVSGMKDKGPSVDVKAQDITAAVIRSFSGQVCASVSGPSCVRLCLDQGVCVCVWTKVCVRLWVRVCV